MTFIAGFASAVAVPGGHGRPPACREAICPNVRKVVMGPWKPGEKDEAFRQQQEILARRRNKKENAKYFEGVEQRRADLESERSKRQLKIKDGEDPLIPWKELKDKGLLEEAGYPDEAPGGPASGGIPLPMASFGIPKYDQGGRFDLKLPHVEVGYTDESADVMGKIGKFFGFGKKKDDSQGPNTEKDGNSAKGK